MYNRHRGEGVSVPMKDGTRKLVKYDAEALGELETILGIKNLLKVLDNPENIEEHFGFNFINAFTWAGMKTAGATESKEEVARMIDLTKLGEYARAIAKALRLALKGAVEDEEADEGKKPAGDASSTPKAVAGP